MNLFSEIYGAYFRIAAKLLESEVTDEKAVTMKSSASDSVIRFYFCRRNLYRASRTGDF